MNEEINRVKVVVINSNTGHIVRSEELYEALYTDKCLLTIVQMYSTKDSIVTVSIDNACYCFYIKDELYIFSTSISAELIEFFKDVLGGLYDNARDSFHIQWGRVATLCQQINDVDYSKYEVILNSIDDIWGTRYYSRFLRRGKND